MIVSVCELTRSTERLPREQIIGQALRNLNGMAFPYAVPAEVNVAYNMAFGEQRCKAVPGFPYLKEREDGGSCAAAPASETTGTAFFSDEPTYVPSTWSGFEIPTGSTQEPDETFTLATSPTSSTLTSSPSLIYASFTLTVGTTSIYSATTATVSPTTSTMAANPTQTNISWWVIAIYSGKGCSGSYMSLEGHNIETTSDQCIVLHSDLSTDINADVMCRWYREGSSAYSACGSSPLTQPQSWQVKGGTCTAYRTDTCDEDGTDQAYSSYQGCHDYSPGDTETWLAISCGAFDTLTLSQMPNGNWWNSTADQDLR